MRETPAAMVPVEPLFVAPLFTPLHHELMDALRTLGAGDWSRPTAAGTWRVRDVVAHLLDVTVRTLSVERDGHRLPPPTGAIDDYGGLVGFLDALNADWVRAAARLSPQVLVSLIDHSGRELAAFVSRLDPMGPAPFGVAWAGETESPSWFHVARQYTEHWHHQQQIREAVGAPDLTGPQWLAPLIDTGVRALPATYRAVASPTGTTVSVRVIGAAGGEWTLARLTDAWRLFRGRPAASTATVTLDEDAAWRVLFKAIDPARARARAAIEGETALGDVFFDALALMAIPRSPGRARSGPR
jgi:uncharacterized protein (TIGR03083 family)